VRGLLDAGPYEVTMVDDATRMALSPGVADAGGPTIWDVVPGAVTLIPSCSITDGGSDYPPAGTGFGLGLEEVPGTFFTLQAVPPRGVWIVEGNMDTGGATTGGCPGDGLGRSLNVVGSVIHTTNDLTLVPAAPKGYALLAGRDLLMTTGNAKLSTCATAAGGDRRPGDAVPVVRVGAVRRSQLSFGTSGSCSPPGRSGHPWWPPR
jgi:hypothetical protein